MLISLVKKNINSKLKSSNLKIHKPNQNNVKSKLKKITK